jgi:hypothetical protein
MAKLISVLSISLALVCLSEEAFASKKQSKQYRTPASTEDRDTKCSRCLPIATECIDKVKNKEFKSQTECLKANDCSHMDCAD